VAYSKHGHWGDHHRRRRSRRAAWDLWNYSQKYASGEINDPTFAPIIFAAPPDADWQDEAAWHAANPAIEAGFYSLE
jgi:phage terminase large subunit-like protein